jgi:hypothetical protein
LVPKAFHKKKKKREIEIKKKRELKIVTHEARHLTLLPSTVITRQCTGTL